MQNIVLAGHAKPTEREQFLAEGRAPGEVREEIVASWHRSNWFGVGADGPIELPFRDDVERDTRLVRAARPVLDDLEQVLADSDVSVILADASAYIVDRRVPANGELRRRLDRFCGVPGACWSEEMAGTNGIGTAIEDRRLTSVVGHDHFVDSLTLYACVGAPIVHPVTRRVEGVLDLSCASRDASRFMAVIAAKAAREIEVGLLDQSHGHHQLLLERFLRVARNSRLPVIALAGEVVLTNHAATRLLDAADQAILRELATDPGAGTDRRVTLSDGRAGEVRYHPLSNRGEHVGAVLEVKLAGEASAAQAQARTGITERRPGAVDALAGGCAVWQQVCDKAARRVAGSTPLLLVGEPGTGKRTLAEALVSDRGPATILDATLAGCENTATWAGAIRAHLRRPGAVILQHVDGLDLERRRILAAALDEWFGGGRVCAVVATAGLDGGDNARLGPLSARFGDPVPLPSLEERREDIPDLVARFASRHAPQWPTRFDTRVLQALMRSDWPGNIRELETLVAQLVAERRGYDVRVEHLPADRSGRLAAMRLRRIDRAQCDTILEALRRAQGNKTEAAAALGIARSTLYRKMVQFGLEDPSSSDSLPALAAGA